MYIYLFVYICGFLFATFAEKNFIKEKKTKGIIFSIIAILIPTIIAGIRGITVGTDTSGYITNIYNSCSLYDNFGRICTFNVGIERGYILVTYLVYKLFGNVNVLYGVLEAIILVFIYKACYDNRNSNGEYAIAYFAFLALFYNKSFNMCRQIISMSIVLYAFKYVLDKKFFKYIFWLIVATTFHRSAIVQVILYFAINIIFNKDKLVQLKKFIGVSIIGGFVIGYEYWMQLGISIMSGGYNNRYLIYINNVSNIIVCEFIFEMVLLLFLYVIRKNLLMINKNNDIYIFVYMLGVILYLCGLKGSYAYRLSYYFYFYVIMLFPNMKLVFNKGSQSYFIALILLILMIYAYMYYGILLYDQTVPYTTMWN